MSTPITQSALDAFKARAVFKGATESDLVEGLTDLVASMARVEHELAKTERLRFGADADRRQLRAELERERTKARLLRDACESICEEWGKNYDTNPIGAGQRMSTIAGNALEKAEDAT